MSPRPDSSSDLFPFSPSIEALGDVLTSSSLSYQRESCLSLLSKVEGAAAIEIRQMLQIPEDFSLEKISLLVADILLNY